MKMIVEIALLLSCAATVHPDTIRDIAWVESRMNPYAIGVVKGKGIMPRTHKEAVFQLKQLEDDNKNYSVGLMQINKVNFKRYGVTAEEMLDPCKNLSVFEKIITDCYERGKTMPRALSCYYSGGFEVGQKKEPVFAGTSYLDRIGKASSLNYRVPSARVAKEESGSLDSKASKSAGARPLRTIYPEHVIKNTTTLSPGKPTKVLKGE